MPALASYGVDVWLMEGSSEAIGKELGVGRVVGYRGDGHRMCKLILRDARRTYPQSNMGSNNMKRM